MPKCWPRELYAEVVGNDGREMAVRDGGGGLIDSSTMQSRVEIRKVHPYGSIRGAVVDGCAHDVRLAAGVRDAVV